jgi:hypothetical protein
MMMVTGKRIEMQSESLVTKLELNDERKATLMHRMLVEKHISTNMFLC